MQGNGPGYPVETLLERLEEVRDEDMAVVAALWTWLEGHLLPLGSLEEKPPVIRSKAIALSLEAPYQGIDDKSLEWLEASPLRNAAELLARIALSYEDRDAPLTSRQGGIDGSEVIVTARQPALTKAMGKAPSPPTSVEHPSLFTLAPRLGVFPTDHNGIRLEIEELHGVEWELIQASFETAFESPSDQQLCVHLDSLGERGLSGWDPDPQRRVGRFNPAEMTSADLQDCKKEVKAAVEAARGPVSILLMPELAAAPEVLSSVQKALQQQEESPLLTVIGAYHRTPKEEISVDQQLLGGAKIAGHVNEAIAFGPEGEELWCQRKMSCAAGGAKKVEDRFVEDIQLGDCLKIVPSALGTMAIVICLDAFVPHVRERLLRSPAEVLLVPSLSPSIRRHRQSLQQLVHTIWGVAFVCNRSPYEKGSPLNLTEESIWNDERNRSFWVPDDLLPCPEEGDAEPERPAFVCRIKTAKAPVPEEPS